MGIFFCEVNELRVAIIVEFFLVIIRLFNFDGKIQVQDEIAVAFGGRIFSDIKFPEETLKLIFLIDVVIVFEHGDCKALAETARADKEEILV